MASIRTEHHYKGTGINIAIDKFRMQQIKIIDCNYNCNCDNCCCCCNFIEFYVNNSRYFRIGFINKINLFIIFIIAEVGVVTD